MLRNDITIDRIIVTPNLKSLQALSKIMKFSLEEEIIANALKILRYCIRDDKNHLKTVAEYPDMINEVILDVFANFDNS
jgi:hypothetical protein